MVLRFTPERLAVFQGEKDGGISMTTALAILAFVKSTPTLSAIERRPVVEGLAAFVTPPDPDSPSTDG